MSEDKVEKGDRYEVSFHQMKALRLQSEIALRQEKISRLTAEIAQRNLDIDRLRKEISKELEPLKLSEDLKVAQLLTAIDSKYEMKEGDNWNGETGEISRNKPNGVAN